MKTDPIQDYILKSEQNLRIAATVSEAWPDAREKLVSAFLDRLDTRVKRKLKGWKFERWGGRFFRDARPGYYFWKPAWKNQYYLCLGCREYGKQMIFGVERDKNRIGKRPPSGTLLEAVQEVYPSARMNSSWEARITMRAPAADWRNFDVLMADDDKILKFLDSVAEQLLELKTISAPFLERLLRKE